jgi:hypothetical protein
MRVQRRTWLVLVAVPLAAGAGWLFLDAFQRALVGPPHEFTVVNPPAFLTEELALAKARETLARDAPRAAEWVPVAREHKRSTAPDGRPDEYLQRDQGNPNLGFIRFVEPGKQGRSVSVELIGERVVCQSTHLK